MLTRVDVQSENPFYLKIRDARPTDSIIVEKIEGLSPPDVDLFMGDYARDGGYYSGRRVPPRTVIFTLLINPNYKNNESVSGLRKMLYKAFMDPYDGGDAIGFVLKDDELPDRVFHGYTEKFEGDLFSDETTVQITVRAPNPYLRDLEETVLNPLGSSFPFEYNGSAETGLSLIANVSVATNILQFRINSQLLVLNYAFQAGDEVSVDTVRGQRNISVKRGTTTDILYAKSPNTNWLEIHAEDNNFSVYGDTGDSVVASISELRYYGQHWGI